MSKLQTLDIEQEKLMEVVRDEWIATALSGDCSVNTEEIEAGIEYMYGLANLAKPRVMIFDSPLACVLAARMMGARDLRNTDYYQGLGYWSGWASFYDFFGRIGITGVADHDGLRRVLRFMRAGVWDVVLRENVAFISRRPALVKKDERGRLHCANGPSVLFRDGFALYSWHGTTVPDRAILEPESYTAEEIRAERNSEIVRALAERLGWERFLAKLEAITIDKGADESTGLTYELIDFAQRVGERMPRLLKMQSPRLNDETQPFYVEPVPPDVTTWQAARRWQIPNQDGTWPEVHDCNTAPDLKFAAEA